MNPYDESAIAEVASARSEDVDLAIGAARVALQSSEWKSLGASDRGLLLWRLADLCERDQNILATIDSWDSGKPYNSVLSEDIAEVISVLRYYAGWADKIHGQTIETTEAKFAYTRREPIGVCGQIIPWNFPAMVSVLPRGVGEWLG